MGKVFLVLRGTGFVVVGSVILGGKGGEREWEKTPNGGSDRDVMGRSNGLRIGFTVSFLEWGFSSRNQTKKKGEEGKDQEEPQPSGVKNT